MESPDAMTEVQEQDSQEQDSSSSSGNIVAWPLLQKGLKKALGETRDQLEFTIKIRSMFDAFDHSGDRQLDGNELRKELRRMGVLVSKREMDGLMLRFDQNRDNQIDFGEFQDMVNDLIPPPEFDLGGIFLEQKLAVSSLAPYYHFNNMWKGDYIGENSTPKMTLGSITGYVCFHGHQRGPAA